MRYTTIMTAALCSVFTGAVMAAPMAINDLPTESTGPFQHNVFHSASSNGGQSGTIYSWFTLGVGGGSWDPVSGAFSLNVDLWNDAGATVSEGTATATGNLNSAAFNGYDGGLIGSITWDFTHATDSYLNGLGSVTLSFLDYNYATSTQGYTANSTTANSMTLWGADGSHDVNGNFSGATMGMDMVATFVPVPAAVWLFGSGLLGLVGVARRKSS